jgi:Zn-finger nucleic acid-binding protein
MGETSSVTNCPNCGAAMELVPSGRYFRCRHCGTYHFHQTVEAEGIRIVGHVQDAPACPVCGTAMARAVIDDQHPIDFCTKCRGLLLPRETFAHVANTRRAWATTPPSEPVPLNRKDLARKLACPKCHRKFETFPHYGPGNVVIDNCTSCDVVWLDYGELQQIVDAPGRDRGGQYVPRIDEEYVREGPPRPDPEQDHRDGRSLTSDPLTLLLYALFDRK